MNFPQNMFNFVDSFRSMLTGLGVPGRDRVTSLSPSLDTITYNLKDLENLYRSNWIAKKIVDIPAFDCTRSWRTWDGEQDDVQKIEDAEKEFALQRKILDAMIKSRLYGGAAIVMGIKGQKFNEELDIDTVGEGDLKFVHVVEKWMIQAGPRVRDITSPWFGEPSYYMRSNTPVIEAPGGVTPIEGSSLGYQPGDTIFIHPSRVVRLVGIEYPDVEHSPDAWGDSVLASIYEAIRDASLVTQSLANLIADAKVDVFKIPGLTSTLSTQAGTDKMISYFANANVAKSVVNSLVIDKEIDWQRIQTKFEGLPEVLQAYLMICSAGADIPSTRMLSREPSGQNATGESDTRNYYDRLSSEQAVILTPTLSRLDEVLIRHSLGDRPKEITYDWNPLWQMTDTEKADIALKKAQAYQIDVNTALIPAEALVIGRQNQLIEDGVYPGLETALDELEDNWNEEAEFLPVQQLNQQQTSQEQNLQQSAQQHKETLSAQERIAKNNPPQKPPGNGNSNGSRGSGTGDARFRDARRHLRLIQRSRDDSFQGGLGFLKSQASEVEGRVVKRKRPFARAVGDPDPDINYGPNDPNGETTEDADWDESKHTRGQPGNSGQFGSGGGGIEHSHWSEGHGTEGEEFVSPNIEHLDFHGAVKALDSYHHEQFKRAANQIDAATNAYAVERDVVGAWSDGAEDSTMMVSPKISHDDLVLNAAMKGVLARQKAVLVFDADEHGPHQLYHLQIPGSTLLSAHEELLKDGIEFHTLLPREAGTEVIVVDTDGSMRNKLDKLADRHGASGVVYNGKAEFIGTTKEDGSDEDQRADAVKQYENVIAHSQSNKRGVWPQLRDRWARTLRSSEPYRALGAL